MKLLAVSFAYPPLAYPRAIQVARLLKNLNTSTVLVCADEIGARKDPTIEPDAERKLETCIRVPFVISPQRRLVDRVLHRVYEPLWKKYSMIPDRYSPWGNLAFREAANFINKNAYIPDLIVTFAQPFTTHLVGLQLRERYGRPWLAHFSDPWTDNTFNNYDDRTRRLNLELERKVVENADILVFTSSETIDLVFGKYPNDWKRKARLLPHGFASSDFKTGPPKLNQKIILRYLGKFYGNRTALPLVDAIRRILEKGLDGLTDICFELIGTDQNQMFQIREIGAFPEGLVQFRPPVGYKESLDLMAEADGLLIIDAPAEKSVFLPSKLIDYIGAGRPVLGITPPGSASKLIQELGGPVADPSDIDAMVDKILIFINQLRKRRVSNEWGMWGEQKIRDRYEAGHVANLFEEILMELIDSPANIRKGEIGKG